MIERLKKRRDYLATARGTRAHRRAFVLETLRRGDEGPARFGFTVSKRAAKKAVERNRIRRRLKEAARLIAPERAVAGHDYVLVGKSAALTQSFAAIGADLAAALKESVERAIRPHDARARSRAE
jgi:ribonuclease P protein component